MNKKMLTGSFWLSFGSIFSKILGIVYLIPWLYMLGSASHQTTAQALFNIAYTPYALFISLGTAGFPSAIARRVSYLLGKNQFLDAKKVAKVGFLIMLASGVVCSLILYIIAPFLAANSPVASLQKGTVAIRCLVPAILIIPSMSVIRGWFQGNSDLKTFGISQIWEQLIRIIIILGSTAFIIFILNHSFIEAVYASISAAFGGALVSYLYLLLQMRKSRDNYRELELQSLPIQDTKLSALFVRIAYESIPFILIGSGITLSQLVDQLFFKQILQGMRHFSTNYIQSLYTYFSANPNKITTLTISLALAVAETSLPLISVKLGEGDKKKDIIALVTNNFSLLIFAMGPVITIGTLLAYQINGIFFGFNLLASKYLAANLWQSLILGGAIDALTIMQALRMSKKASKYLLIGLALKLILQIPLVFALQGFGAILATAIAFGVILVLCVKEISHYYPLSHSVFGPLVKLNILFIFIATGIMWASGLIMKPTDIHSKLLAFVFCAFWGLVLLLIYIELANRFDVTKAVFSKKLGYKYGKHKHFK